MCDLAQIHITCDLAHKPHSHATILAVLRLTSPSCVFEIEPSTTLVSMAAVKPKARLMGSSSSSSGHGWARAKHHAETRL